MGSDLIRDSVQPVPVPLLIAKLAVLAVLAIVSFVAGDGMLHRTAERLRRRGSTEQV